MKRLLSAAFLSLVFLNYGAAAYAYCSTQTITHGRKTTVCTTCCNSDGQNCFTTCV